MNDSDSGQYRLLQALERLRLHDHLCLIYETQEEQFAAAIPFMRMGLERGEQCVYIADDNTVTTVLNAMRAEGIDVEAAIKTGALDVITKQDAYLKEGYFDPDGMIRFLTETTEAAKQAGFSGLRATGEMTWALGGDPGTDRLIEYEAKLNRFFPKNDCVAICQYNRHRFSPQIILNVIRTHPLVIFGGVVCKNFYYVPPDEFLQPNQVASEVERLLNNIRERERAEDAVRQANRALRVLSECNQALVRATDESVLLNDVCRIIVEDGEYRLAWVGFAEQGEGKTVRPVAQYGFEEGYLDTLNVTWADTERGRGPTGTAIRSGEPAIARHILTDPQFAPWREAATKRGYASSIALPLIANGQTLGALNIYAMQPDAFDAEEVKLLRELSDDLAFGITTLRIRAERKQAQAALRESERQFRDLYENAPNAYFSVGVDGRVRRCNRRAGELLGYAVEGLVGRPALELYADTPQGKAKASKVLERFRAGETVRGEELQMQRADGTPVWISLAVKAIRDAQGQIVESRSMVVDIAERKRAAEALWEERSKAQEYLDIAGVVFVAIDVRGEVTLINQKGCEILGYKQEEIIGKNWFDNFLPERISGEVKSVFQKLMAGEVEPVEYFENLVLTKSDEERTIAWHNTVLRDEAGNITSTLSSGEDITERKRAEEALRESEERFRRAVADAPFPMLIHAEDGEIVVVNQMWAEITGYAHQDIPTIADWTERAYGVREELVRADIDRLYDLEGRLYEGEYVITTRSGEQRTWEFSSSPVGRMPEGRRRR